MSDPGSAHRAQIVRQVGHWTSAAARLEKLDDLASAAAWSGLEQYLGLSVRRHLQEVVQAARREAAVLQAAMEAARTPAELAAVRRRLLGFRAFYLRVETTLDFFAGAINTRTSPAVAGLMRACDTLAHRSMRQLLDALGRPTPAVLTYLDKGLGASILKAGLRLWDATSVNPVAAVKITRHNLHRPTALIHEAGHQVAHIVGWNAELASTLSGGLPSAAPGVADTWAGWASEIAADAFAFVHTGYASVAALHDVLAGEEAFVYRHHPGDPHPVSWLRVLLGVEMCRSAYGSGPWDELAAVWTELYPAERAPAACAALLRDSVPHLPRLAELTLRTPLTCFGGRPLTAIVDPERVSPRALLAMEAELGGALYTSMHWIWTESLRLLALTGYRKATLAGDPAELIARQEEWMLRLGGALKAA
jgi:hypothetical protein